MKTLAWVMISLLLLSCASRHRGISYQDVLDGLGLPQEIRTNGQSRYIWTEADLVWIEHPPICNEEWVYPDFDIEFKWKVQVYVSGIPSEYVEGDLRLYDLQTCKREGGEICVECIADGFARDPLGRIRWSLTIQGLNRKKQYCIWTGLPIISSGYRAWNIKAFLDEEYADDLKIEFFLVSVTDMVTGRSTCGIIERR